MRRTLNPVLGLVALLVLATAVQAQGRGAPRPASPTPGASTARDRQAESAKRVHVRNKKNGGFKKDAGDEDGDDRTTGPEAPTDAAKKEAARKLRERWTTALRRAGDRRVRYELVVLAPDGDVRKLRIRHLQHLAGDRRVRHRITVHQKKGRILLPMEELILHEERGSSLKAWIRGGKGGFRPLGDKVLEYQIAGSPLSLHGLLPFDPERYELDYKGTAFRAGERCHVFTGEPRYGGASPVSVGLRTRDGLPGYRAVRDKRGTRWEAVATRLRIRDGVPDLEHQSFERGATSFLLTVQKRSSGAELDEAAFDPGRGGF